MSAATPPAVELLLLTALLLGALFLVEWATRPPTLKRLTKLVVRLTLSTERATASFAELAAATERFAEVWKQGAARREAST